MTDQSFKQPNLQQIKQTISLNMSANKVEKAYLFGSYARGDANADSDIDIAVDMQASADLLDLIRFKQNIEASLMTKVDVTTKRSITPQLKTYIEPDMIAI